MQRKTKVELAIFKLQLYRNASWPLSAQANGTPCRAGYIGASNSDPLRYSTMKTQSGDAVNDKRVQ